MALSLSVSHSRSRTETRQCSLLTARRYKTSVSRVAEFTWCQRTEKLSKIRLTLSSSLTVLCGQPVHEKVKLTPVVHIMTGVTFRWGFCQWRTHCLSAFSPTAAPVRVKLRVSNDILVQWYWDRTWLTFLMPEKVEKSTPVKLQRWYWISMWHKTTSLNRKCQHERNTTTNQS